LKLQNGKPLSKFGFNFNLRRYAGVRDLGREKEALEEALNDAEVGRCRLAL
jgi:hypothetical protein